MEIVNVKNYVGRYAVTDGGDVYSLKSGKKLTPELSENGYMRVTLYDNGVPQKHLLHRLVYFSFNPLEDNGRKDMVVDHINENKRDNRLVNLRYITSRENTAQCTVFNENGLPRGVAALHDGRGYSAIITISHKRFFLGSFNDPSDAGEAYNRALQHYEETGEFPYERGEVMQIRNDRYLPHGVYLHRNGKKYLAYAILGMKRYSLGAFETVSEAVAARNEALKSFAENGSLPQPRELSAEKYCSHCDQMKPRAEFYRNRKGGYSWLCKECSKQVARENDAARRKAKLNNQNS